MTNSKSLLAIGLYCCAAAGIFWTVYTKAEHTIPALASNITVCTPGIKGCSIPLIVPFFYDDVARPNIIVTIDGKRFQALLDTGASSTLIDARLTGVRAGTHQRIRDFHGDIITSDVGFMKVCIASLCDYEDVNIVPMLIDPVVLRGSFFNRFRTMTINYSNKTLKLEGWQ